MRTLQFCKDMNKKAWTTKKLNEELKHDYITDKELNQVDYYKYIENVLKNIENIRKKRLKELKSSNGINEHYTQKDVAKRAGVSIATYKNYMSRKSYNISLITVLKIAHVLRCDLNDILPADQYKK